MSRPHPDNRKALPFLLPFLAVYGLFFAWPTLQMIWMSFTSSQLIVPGDFIGFPACFFESALFSVAAVTDAVVSSVPMSRLLSLPTGVHVVSTSRS